MDEREERIRAVLDGLTENERQLLLAMIVYVKTTPQEDVQNFIQAFMQITEIVRAEEHNLLS